MTEEETRLWEEHEKLTRALRRFIDPQDPEYRKDIPSSEAEYEGNLRKSLHDIQLKLDEIHKTK